MTMLTPEEIKTLDAVNGIVPDLYAAVERIVTARVSAALREAADDMGKELVGHFAGCPANLPTVLGHKHECNCWIGWLQKRADSYDSAGEANHDG